MPGLATRAPADRDRQRSGQGRHRRHHDGPEPHAARLENRVARGLAVAPFGIEREVDHHDRVFLHEAHQHDNSHERIDAQLGTKDEQREQRAESRKWQARQNRERVNEAFVENAQHDVDHDDREQQQEDQPLLARLERLRRARESGADGRGQRLPRGLLDVSHRRAERHARRQVERQGHGRELPAVVHAQGADVIGGRRD